MQFPDSKRSDASVNRNNHKWFENLSPVDYLYVAIPIIIICTMIVLIVMDLRPHFWLKTTGTITRSYMTEEMLKTGRYENKYYVANVEYTFAAHGEKYISARRTGGLWGCDFADRSEYQTTIYLAQNKVGKKIPVYYKESDPSTCCMEQVFSTTAKWCIFLLFLIIYETLHQLWPKIFWRPPLSK